MMKLILLLLFPIYCFSQIRPSEYPFYSGKDLGVTYTATKTVFKVWAPKASAIKLRLYKNGTDDEAIQTLELSKSQNGVWKLDANGNLANNYYTFQVLENGKWLKESPDIYAKAVGMNGKRGIILNLAETNPENWEEDRKPDLLNFTDIILYESHLRDISINTNSGIERKGKYLGIIETGTKSAEGLSTGLDHLKELGVTHIHLLPTYDFNSIDESQPELKNYNWGYDPLNYNAPEGSYASDAINGAVRIKEFKEMVQGFHANGIRVVLDMVYNHTANTETPFNQFAPQYFYRQNATGGYSNASGCGNETASERPMVQKFILESVAYWATEYHVDGFRFDLMGVHDIATMNLIRDTLDRIDSSIFIYGEGWAAGDCAFPEVQRAVKKNTLNLVKIAAFSDDIRDGLHGPYNKVDETGFVSGAKGMEESVKFGIVASIEHPQIDYSQVNYSKAPWANEPSQTINYVSCHDDNTLFDRLTIGNPDASEEELIKMDKLSQAIVLTSQGVPFIHSGAELLRSKKGIANSYNSPDSINELDWSRKEKYSSVFNYYKLMISLRKHHPAFRMPTSKMIQEHLSFFDTKDSLFIAYQLSNNANGDVWKDILVLLNANATPKAFELPAGIWILASDGNTVKEKGLERAKAKISVPATTAYILFRAN